MTRLAFYFLALGLAACTVARQPGSQLLPQQRQQLDSRLRQIGEVPPGLKSYTLHCIDDMVCWTGDSLKQWRTDDKGQHWRLIYAANPNGGQIRTVEYVNERIGWILTLEKLLKTDDGGQNWTEQSSPIPMYPLGEMTAVTFLKGSKIGWASGGVYRPQTRNEQRMGVPTNMSNPLAKTVLRPAISRSEDGGKTWIRQSIQDTWGRIYAPTFLDERQGVAIGDSGIFYTMNGGQQWKGVNFRKSCTDERYLEGYDMRPLEVFFLDSQNTWLTFEDGRIAKSTDGGQSWCDLLAPNAVKFDYYEKYFKKIHFATAAHGWGLGANGLVYETKDGGKTWVKVLSIQFDDMFFLNDESCWLVSKAGLFQMAN